MIQPRRSGAPSVETPGSGTHSAKPDHPSLSFERIVFFSDAVFAIVITLLVLPLTAEIELVEGAGVAHQVIELGPRVLTFVVSFLVIGQFWIAHHRLFGYLRRYDAGLLWLNVVSLLTVAFMPFPAALLGAQSTARDRFPVVFYAASLTVASACLTSTWVYALRRRLVDESLDHRQVAEFTLRAVTTTAIFMLSIGAAFLGLLAAVIIWVALPPLVRIVAARHYRASTGSANAAVPKERR
jgi:uncharacterized membrane protein